eukprot:scaffold197225_cov46-Attheya_sp.AAC.2
MSSSKEKISKPPGNKGAKARYPKKSKTPSTVLDKIVFAVRALRGGPKGSSRPAIAKFLKSEFDQDNATALKMALKKGVSSGVLIQTGQSFRVADDPVEEVVEEEGVEIDDTKLGIGEATAADGDTVTVSYVGILDSGYQFDKASTFTFVLGAGDVIKGWDSGVTGMKVGGKRKLVVPSKFGYGKRGCKPDIPPNATLHFSIKLKSIK